MGLNPESALVLFSGGQDSTVCLAWALEQFARVETIEHRLLSIPGLFLAGGAYRGVGIADCVRSGEAAAAAALAARGR